MSDLRRDLNSLRKQLNDTRELQGARGFSSALINEGYPAIPNHGNELMGSAGVSPTPHSDIQDAEAEEIKTEEPETLNLSDLGRQTVEKALERNGGNRKKAAQELGISDRTLYRRIKQYGLTK